MTHCTIHSCAAVLFSLEGVAREVETSNTYGATDGIYGKESLSWMDHYWSCHRHDGEQVGFYVNRSVRILPSYDYCKS